MNFWPHSCPSGELFQTSQKKCFSFILTTSNFINVGKKLVCKSRITLGKTAYQFRYRDSQGCGENAYCNFKLSNANETLPNTKCIGTIKAFLDLRVKRFGHVLVPLPPGYTALGSPF